MKIDKGIPIPQGRGKRRIDRPALSDLKVGDSYFAPNQTQTSMSAVRMESRANRIPITTRALTEKGIKGVRVWRIG